MPQPQRKHIVVAEDDRDIREALRELFEGEGHAVRTARDGKEALDILADANPCILIFDWNMPHMSGDALLATLREADLLRSIPVVVISAQHVAPEMLEGVAGFMAKPLQIEALLALVREYCPAVLSLSNQAV